MMKISKPILATVSLAILCLLSADSAFAHDGRWDDDRNRGGWNRGYRDNHPRNWGGGYGGGRYDDYRGGRGRDGYRNRWNDRDGADRYESRSLRNQRREIEDYRDHIERDGHISKNELKTLKKYQRSYRNNARND